jgi:hypothetical protein
MSYSLQDKFGRALAMLANWPEPAVAKWCAIALIRDQGPRVGVLPTAGLIREIPALSPQQRETAGWLMNHALQSMKGPTDEPRQ